MGIIDTISFIAKIKQKADSLKDYLGGKKEEPKSKGGNMLFDILSMGRTQMKRRAEKIKEQAEQEKTTQVKRSYGVYSTDYEDDYVYVVYRASAIQK